MVKSSETMIAFGRCRWKTNIKKLLKGRGCKNVKWIHPVQGTNKL